MGHQGAAGFIDPGTGRFIKPGIGGARDESSGAAQEPDHGGGGGGNEPPAIDPIFAGLLKRLPKSGDVWPEAERKVWLQLLEGSFKLIYRDESAKEANLRTLTEKDEAAN